MEQSGIYRVTLYENRNIAIIYNEDGTVQSIANSGYIIDITECDNKLINYVDNVSIGPGGKITHNYEVSFSNFGFQNEDLAKLGSIFGFIPALYFNNQQPKIVLNAPIFFDSSEYNEANTQFYPISLFNQVPTTKELVDFSGIPLVWILEDGVWNDVGEYWLDNGIWND